MLKITPYLGIIVLIISIGGLFYPKLSNYGKKSETYDDMILRLLRDAKEDDG